jgi:hypothetical protein
MSDPILKAFVLCEAITDFPGGLNQRDLHGAGLSIVRPSGPFPFKHSFWVYIEITDQQAAAGIQLALMRADSGRRHFFREVTVTQSEPLSNMRVSIRLFGCVFPVPGIYFLELWYDGSWLLDQRLELVES